MAVCPKRNKPQVNALAVNDLDRELSDEVLNEWNWKINSRKILANSQSMLYLDKTTCNV
jgi:hypothetical protein